MLFLPVHKSNYYFFKEIEKKELLNNQIKLPRLISHSNHIQKNNNSNAKDMQSIKNIIEAAIKSS